MNATTAIATAEPQLLSRRDTPGAFESIEAFENVQRMAKLLCGSSIVPQSYRDNLADTVIALEMSNRMGANPLAVMQNLYIVHGKPGWSAQFLISCVNTSGKFSPLRYRMIGTKGSDSWGCVAWAKDKLGQTLESAEVTIAMAKAEGWYAKNGSKWKTMPELMLQYRSATFFTRAYAPELTMGMQTVEEIVDIGPTTPEIRKPLFSLPTVEAQQIQPFQPYNPPSESPKEPRKPRAKPPAEPVQASEPVQEPEVPVEAEKPVYESPAQPATPQDELAEFVTVTCTANFENLCSALVNLQWVKGAQVDVWTSFDDIPLAIVQKCLKSKSGLGARLEDEKALTGAEA